jgi:hypothetical protein
VRVAWLSLTEKPELNLAIRPLDGTVLSVRGRDWYKLLDTPALTLIVYRQIFSVP